MTPGPAKSFDPDEALLRARDLFWARGYDGTSIRDLEAALGVGRKSLYDTFGGKRTLFLRSLALYTDTVVQRICDGLERPGASAHENLARVLDQLQRHHGSKEGRGCMLGVALAQADPADEELTGLLAGYLGRLERALEHSVRRAQAEGALRADLAARDVARQLVALTQGVALLGRLRSGSASPRGAVRAALAALAPPRRT